MAIKESTRTINRFKASVLTSLNIYELRHYYILIMLFGICSLVYYFGELINLAGWQNLKWEFFYTVHDVHRLLFLIPLIYAGYHYDIVWVAIVVIGSFIAFLPRALFISPFPDPLLRVVLFTLIEAVIGFLFLVNRQKIPQNNIDKVLIRNEKQELSGNRIPDENIVTIGILEIDLSKRQVRRLGLDVKLTHTEYKLLEYLVLNTNKILTHQELLRHVWGSEYGKESEYLRTFISQLRKKLEEDPSKPKIIITVQGFGYRFVIPG